MDNAGRIHRVALLPGTSEGLRGNILHTDPVDTEPDLALALCFGLTQRDKVEWILQKGTEIGVAAFHPFISSRTLVQRTELSEKKVSRWGRIIREAAEQSHRGRLPVLHRPEPLTELLTGLQKRYPICLMAWEGAAGEGRGLEGLVEPSGEAALIVGPEGGFSEDEVQAARSGGCQILSLGQRILRMETAAIVFPALVLYAADAL